MDSFRDLNMYNEIISSILVNGRMLLSDISSDLVTFVRPRGLDVSNENETMFITENYTGEVEFKAGTIVTVLSESVSNLVNKMVALDNSKATILVHNELTDSRMIESETLVQISKTELNEIRAVKFSKLFFKESKLSEDNILLNRKPKRRDVLKLNNLLILSEGITLIEDLGLELCNVRLIDIGNEEVKLHVTMNQYYPLVGNDTLEVKVPLLLFIGGLSVNKLIDIILVEYKTITLSDNSNEDLSQFESSLSDVDYFDFYSSLSRVLAELSPMLGRINEKSLAYTIMGLELEKLHILRCIYLEMNLNKENVGNILDFNFTEKLYEALELR